MSKVSRGAQTRRVFVFGIVPGNSDFLDLLHFHFEAERAHHQVYGGDRTVCRTRNLGQAWWRTSRFTDLATSAHVIRKVILP
jgi:hypothetical protein